MKKTLTFTLFAFLSTNLLAATDSLVQGFERPQDSFWGGWDRGSVGSVYSGWDAFEASPTVNASNDSTPDGYVTYVMRQNDPNVQPDFTKYGVAPNPILQGFPDSQIIAGPGLGIFVTSTNNWYSFSAAPSYTVILLADEDHQNTTGPITVAFQIATIGNNLDHSTVLLAGVDQDGSYETPDDIVNLPYDSKVKLFTDGFMYEGEVLSDGYREDLFLWTIDHPQQAYEIRFTAVGSSMSLDALAIDIGSNASGNDGYEMNVPTLPAFGMLSLFVALLLSRKKES